MNTTAVQSEYPKNSGLFFSKMDLIKALNAYRTAEPENLRVWSITFLEEHCPDMVAQVEKARSDAFVTYGALCRLSKRGYDFDDQMKGRILDHFRSVVEARSVESDTHPVADVVISKAAPKAYKMSRSREALEESIDILLSTGKVVIPTLLATDSMTEIEQMATKTLKEVSEEPDQFLEQTRKGLKKLMTAVIEKVKQIKTNTKASSSTVVKNPIKQVANVKYCKEVPELKIKSLKPIDLIGRRKAFVYNAKYRQLIVLLSLTGSGFHFVGTTLKNVDFENSSLKTIKKPEDFFANTPMAISSLNKAFKDLKTKSTPLTSSRFNESMLILNVTEKGT